MDTLVCIYALSDKLFIFVRKNEVQESNPPALQVDFKHGTYSVNRLRYFLRYTPYKGIYRTLFTPVEKDKRGKYRELLISSFGISDIEKMNHRLQSIFQKQEVTAEWWQRLSFEWKTWIVDGIIRLKRRWVKDKTMNDSMSLWEKEEWMKYCYGKYPDPDFLRVVKAVDDIKINISGNSDTGECLLNPNWDNAILKLNLFPSDFKTKWETAYVLDILPFMAFPSLRRLQINPWRLDDLDFLMKLPKLEYLEINNCNRCLPAGWDVIKQLNRLEYLKLEKGGEMEDLKMESLRTLVVNDFSRVTFPCCQNSMSLRNLSMDADIIRYNDGDPLRLETLLLRCREVYIDRFHREHPVILPFEIQDISNQKTSDSESEKIRLQVMDDQEENQVIEYLMCKFQGVCCTFERKEKKYPLDIEFTVRKNSGLKEMVIQDKRLKIPRKMERKAGSCHTFCSIRQRYWQKNNGKNHTLI